MSNWFTGEEILREAQRINADRVCFARGSDRWTVYPSLSDIEYALAELVHSTVRVKVKFQRLSPRGNYENLSGYRDIFDFRAVLSELRRWRTGKPVSLEPSEVAEAARLYPQGFPKALARHITNLRSSGVRGDNPVGALKDTAEFMASVRQHSHDSHLEYTYSLVHFLLVAYEHGLHEVLSSGYADLNSDGLAAPISAVANVRFNAERRRLRPAVEVARLNVLGQLASLNDRDEAASIFKEMKTEDTEGWVRAGYFDMGAYTYFDASEVVTPYVRERSITIKSDMRYMQNAESGNTMAAALSADPAFFRIYAHQMLHVAQQLPSVDFVFVLCASEEESADVISDTFQYLDSLAGLNRSGLPTNISFLRSETPQWVESPRTYYAAARFFAVDNLLLKYEYVYVMDIDLTFTENPTDFFAGLKDRAFAMPFAQGHSLLSPWRRFMAGNVFFGRKVRQSSVLSDVENYLTRGLEELNSWMLDQNALAYAVEHSHLSGELDLGSRPLWQFSFRSTWEERYCRGHVEHD